MSNLIGDDEENKKEGWALFECCCGDIHIQRLDDPSNCEPYPGFDEPIFDSDEVAVMFVEAQAAMGSARHVRAIESHKAPSH